MELGLGLGLALRLHLGLGLEFGLGSELELEDALHHRSWIWSTGSQVQGSRWAKGSARAHHQGSASVLGTPTGLPECVLLSRSSAGSRPGRQACTDRWTCRRPEGRAAGHEPAVERPGRQAGRAGLSAHRSRAPPQGP